MKVFFKILAGVAFLILVYLLSNNSLAWMGAKRPVLSRSSVAKDTPIYKIPLSPTTTFWNGDTIFYQLNDVASSGIINRLFDEQAADPLNGVESPVPTTTFTSGFASRMYYPARVVIDLGGMYKITNEYYYDHFGTDTLNILYGSPTGWSTDTIKRYENQPGKWADIGVTLYTRYLKIFYSNKGNQKIKELILYGHLIGDSLSRTPPATRNYHQASTTMSQFIGVNIFGNTPVEVAKVGGTLRKYTNQSYLDTMRAGIPLKDVNFVFTKYAGSGVNQYYYFPYPTGQGKVKIFNPNTDGGGFGYYDTLGIDLYWSTQGVPQYAIENKWRKSIDYLLHPGATGDEPSNYDRLSRMAWTLGAVYGKNSYPSDSVPELVYGHQSGKNIMRYIEAGNENNGTWLNRAAYYTPRQAVAYHSAYYDGDNARLGNRMGIKNADNSIKVLFWGDANNHLQYLKSMAYWAYYERRDHKLPFDIYNIHEYSYTHEAVSPENWKGGYRPYYKSIVDTVQLYCPSCEVWLSEWGFDRNRRSPLAVPRIAGLDSAQIQAQWTARAWFQLSFSGLDRAQIFQIQNDPLKTDYDSTGFYKFNTTGLTSGHQNPKTYQFNYYAYPVYYFQHTIWKLLGNYRPDSIIYENRDSIWVYRYRNVDHPDSVAYAIWSGTETNRSVSRYSIKTGHPNTDVAITQLADKQMLGITSKSRSDANGQIHLMITETPQLLFTTVGKDGGELVGTGDRK